MSCLSALVLDCRIINSLRMILVFRSRRSLKSARPMINDSASLRRESNQRFRDNLLLVEMNFNEGATTPRVQYQLKPWRLGSGTTSRRPHLLTKSRDRPSGREEKQLGKI